MLGFALHYLFAQQTPLCRATLNSIIHISHLRSQFNLSTSFKDRTSVDQLYAPTDLPFVRCPEERQENRKLCLSRRPQAAHFGSDCRSLEFLSFCLVPTQRVHLVSGVEHNQRAETRARHPGQSTESQSVIELLHQHRDQPDGAPVLLFTHLCGHVVPPSVKKKIM